MRGANIYFLFLALAGWVASLSPVSASTATFSNPVLWEDYPDLDVFRVGSVFYYSSSTFAYSPGAPVLKSYDLVNWTPVSHSVPELNFGAKYDLNGSGRGYVGGIWASSLRYRPSRDLFYWIGCVDGGKTYIWTAPGRNASTRDGEVDQWNWTAQSPINTCYYDCGLLVDDDDTLYVAYGSTNIQVAQLSTDGFSQVKTQKVYNQGNTYIEGSRMYKINGTYYILVTQPSSAEWVLKSTSGPFGPYEQRTLVDKISGPLSNAGYSHQGGIVATPVGDWYYVAFMDSYPGGRVPVVAPLTWKDGWPSVVTDSSGGWGKTYPMPVQTNQSAPPPVGLDNFTDQKLSDEWEWNHNPDTTKWKLAGTADGGLILETADVTTDLFSARNTLTHRVIGPISNGTFCLDISGMKPGDRAGAALFRDVMAYIGVYKDASSGTSKIVVVNNLTLSDGNWATVSNGTVAATGPTLADNTTDIWLRVRADITPAFNTQLARKATFWYSLDGEEYIQLGPALALTNSYQYFTGYRYAVFNHATTALGGQVLVRSFNMELS